MEIYLLDTDILKNAAAYEKCCSVLPSERLEKAGRYFRDSDRRLSLGAGYLLQLGLAAHGTDYSAVTFGKNGKPEVGNGIYMSISHSGHTAVCAFSDRETGIDIETVRSVGEPLIRRVCTDGEYRRIAELDGYAKDDAFIRLWTAKESFFKCIGKGLGAGINRAEIIFGDDVEVRQQLSPDKFCFREYPAAESHLTVCSKSSSFPPEVTNLTATLIS